MIVSEITEGDERLFNDILEKGIREVKKSE